MYLDKVKKRFGELNVIPAEELKPCTEEEVREFEEHLGLKLPAAYREFLLWMGHEAGWLMRGSDFFRDQIWELREDASDLLIENQSFSTLPDDAFVFYMHQGYQFAFLRTSEGDDPPVYYYSEQLPGNAVITSHPSYSDFLLKAIEEQLDVIARLGPNSLES